MFAGGDEGAHRRLDVLRRKDELLAQLERVELKMRRAELAHTLSAVEKRERQSRRRGGARPISAVPSARAAPRRAAVSPTAHASRPATAGSSSVARDVAQRRLASAASAQRACTMRSASARSARSAAPSHVSSVNPDAVAREFAHVLREKEQRNERRNRWPEAHVRRRTLLSSTVCQPKTDFSMRRDVRIMVNHRDKCDRMRNNRGNIGFMGMRQRHAGAARAAAIGGSVGGVAVAKKVSGAAASTMPRSSLKTMLPTRYKRNEFPFIIGHKAVGNTIQWTCKQDEIDIPSMMPLFFEGLREKEQPFATIANEGILQLLRLAAMRGEALGPVLPSCAAGLRAAFTSGDDVVLRTALRRMQDLLRADATVGRALLPLYPQLLPPLNTYIQVRSNLGDGIEYDQRVDPDIGALVLDTIELLEHRTGLVAFDKIKRFVPTYQSILHTA